MGKRLTNRDTCKKVVAACPEFPKETVEEVFRTTMWVINDLILSGNQVYFNQMMAVYLEKPKPRRQYNPVDGEIQISPAYPRLRMKPSALLKTQIRKGLDVQCYETRE